MKKHNKRSIAAKSGLFILVMLTLAAILSLLVFAKYEANFRTHQQQLAEQTIQSIYSEVDVILQDQHRTAQLFAKDYADDLWHLSQNPDDTATYQKIKLQLDQYFPQHYAFTLTNTQGDIYYDDLGETIGELCLSNILDQLASKETEYRGVIVHPGPGAYHYDVMVPWAYNKSRQGIFFISYHLDRLALALKTRQLPGHQIYLVRNDKPSLIEVSSRGSRDQLEPHRAIHLSSDESSRILYQKKLAGTDWTVINLHDKDLFSNFRLHLLGMIAGVWLIILLIAAVSHIQINRLERKSRAVEKKLQASHDLLEEGVEERTHKLKHANEQLREEIERRDMAEIQQRMFSQAVSQSSDIIYITDTDGFIEYVNNSFIKATGYEEEEITGQHQDYLDAGIDSENIDSGKWRTLDRGGSFSSTAIIRRKDGELLYLDQQISPIHDHENIITQYIVSARDITDDKDNRERLKYLYEHDVVTGLYNHEYFEERINNIIQSDIDKTLGFSIISISLDRFEKIAEGFGHKSSDNIRIEAAKRLSLLSNTGDVVATSRSGGFMILTNLTNDIDELAPHLDNILHVLRKPYIHNEDEIKLTASIGVSHYPWHGRKTDDLIKDAYIAMNRAMRDGGDRFIKYTAGMAESATSRMMLEKQLSKAIEEGNLTFSYQPKIDSLSGSLAGLESLARWRNPENGEDISPVTFIPILEETGMISKLCEYALEDACKLLSNKQLKMDNGLHIALNLSGRQLTDKNSIENLKQIINQYDINPSSIEFEVTESVLVSNLDLAIDILKDIHEMGYKIAIDDFGTGYSSMQYLKHLPFDTIKIDKSFIDEIIDNENDAAFTRTIINMARTLDKQVVAEGVESIEQLQMLRSMGCHTVQGYLVSQPIAHEAILSWVEDYDAKTIVN